MTKKFAKSKKGPNQTGPGYRTSDFFKSKTFGQKTTVNPKFKASLFKIQHKG